MNRKIFISLLVMMTLSIIGITGVQIVWFRNAIKTNNEKFDNAVFVSLNNAANEIESLRKMNTFNNFLWRNQMPGLDSSFDVTGYFSFGSYMTQEGGSVSIQIGNRLSSTDSSGKEHSEYIIRDTTFSDTLHQSTGPGTTGTTGSTRVVNSLESRPIILKQKDFLDWVKKRSSEFQNLSDQMLYEIYQSEKTMELNNTEVLNSLNRFLPSYGINTPFEFAVIKDGVITSASSGKISRNEFLKSGYKVRLFADNLIQRNLLLSVVFPKRTNYVLGSMSWLLGGSLLFSLFIFSTFALSVY